MEFKELGFSDPVMESLHRLGFTHPTPIQEQAIPPLLQGRDLLGRAETGSGKTLAFGLPLIERVEAARVSIQALVVCPTRELAQQVADDLIAVGKDKGVKVALVVGGVHVRTQRMQIPGKQVVVGTPGRIIDLLTDRFLPVEWVEYFVMDEFDRLLDMGFLDDIKRIVKRLPRERQTALFSATVPKMILREAANLLNNPVQIEIGSARRAVDTITQRAIRTAGPKKLAIVEQILKEELAQDGSVIIFCNTKRAVRLVDRELWAKNFSVAALSGDHEQSVRFKVMERFRNQEIRVLVATDVAARGLDIDHIGHVINFDVPFETEDYVHRIGRTGRAGRDGVVTTLVGSDDYQKFERIQKHIEQDIEMLSERCEPLKPKKKSKSAKKTKKKSNRDTSPKESKVDAQAEELPSREPSAEAVEEKSADKPKRRRRRRRGDRDDRGKRDGQEIDKESVDAQTESKSERTREQNPSEESSESNRRRTRGRGRRRNQEQESSERSNDTDEKNDGERSEKSGSRRRRRSRSSRGEDEKEKTGTTRGHGTRDEKKTSPDDKEGRGRRRRSRGGRSEKTDDTVNGSQDDDSKRKDSRGRKRQGRGRNGRRSQSDHERWERELLDRPVELIEDNWSKVDKFEGKSGSDRGRGDDNDNAPAPFEDSNSERAAMAGGSAKRRKATKKRSRSGGAAGEKKSSQPRKEPASDQQKDTKKPEQPSKSKPKDKDKDTDIIW